jgi:hypothetical protein
MRTSQYLPKQRVWNQFPQTTTQFGDAQEVPAPAELEPEPELEAANNKSPTEPVSLTGTE